MIYRIDESVMSYDDRLPYNEVDHATEDKLIEAAQAELLDINIFAEADFIGQYKQERANLKDLKAQWKKTAGTFVRHVWIFRFIDDKQKAALEKHYDVLTDEKCYYSVYKKSFNAICKFMGLPTNQTIIENIVFDKNNSRDRSMWEISVRYSRGFAKVKIPDGVMLTHISPVEGIKELVPSFRSKVMGKYMYPNRRVFFTVKNEIKLNQCGLEGKKTFMYTTKNNVTEAYIDPTYFSFKDGSVYLETETPIPVLSVEKKFFGLVKQVKKDTEEEKKDGDK